MSQSLNNIITQFLLGVLIAGTVALMAQVYYIDLKMVENKKYLVILDGMQKDISNNTDKIERLETQMLNHLNMSHGK